MMRSLLLVLALAACGKSDKPKPEAHDNVIAPRALEGLAFDLPDQWTKTYDTDHDAWNIASADAATKVLIERADERYVASPDAYMHHVSQQWPGKLVTIESRKNVKGGFAMTLGIFTGEKDPNPQHATVVVRELGSRWYRCISEGADSEEIREQVLALCRSVRL
ncbi:MAG TPA: hypothetical protein VFV99_12270 [Kofleriaceae bacterium]|nr:hypothetical protein [Kofleriaceae bacterium]